MEGSGGDRDKPLWSPIKSRKSVKKQDTTTPVNTHHDRLQEAAATQSKKSPASPQKNLLMASLKAYFDGMIFSSM